MVDRSKLTTEGRNPRSRDIDLKSTRQIVEIISAEDSLVAPAVAKERDRIAAAVDLVAEAFRQGGRLFYVGAGTSGRLGVLDASECPPTFGAPSAMVQGIIAGGPAALVRSAEGAEDRADEGREAVSRKRVGPRDVVCGIAACGMTPYVREALERARELGARTIFVTCAPEVAADVKADVLINPVVGPEVITGSTRMKAGTATKLVLNTLTTAAMVRIGKVFGNLMVDLKATSEKLRDRAERIVMEVTGLARGQARRLLAQAEGHAKAAIVMHFRYVGFQEAQALLAARGDNLRQVIEPS